MLMLAAQHILKNKAGEADIQSFSLQCIRERGLRLVNTQELRAPAHEGAQEKISETNRDGVLRACESREKKKRIGFLTASTQ